MHRIPSVGGWATLAIFVLTAPALAQNDSVPQATPPSQGVITRAIAWASTIGGPGGEGFYPELGHMPPGAGLIRGGPGYRHRLFDGRAIVDASASVSWRRYSMARASVEWPAGLDQRVTFVGNSVFQDAPQVNYFGIGARTREDAKTDYGIRSFDLSGAARIRVSERGAILGGGGLLTGVVLKPGVSGQVPSIEQRFDAQSAPGLGDAPRYVHVDLGVERDTRDLPGYPSRGGLYRLQTTAFQDADGTDQSFRRVEADAIQYLPLYHDKTGLAVHGRVTLSQTGTGNAVPFYLLPTLGGSDTLRGYSDYRFRDRNAALVNLEYRWRVFGLMDAALFTDLGTVAPAASGLLRQPWSRDYGFGMRLHSERRSLARIDVARGAEGMRLVFSMTAPFGSSRPLSPVPYVP
jgi:hypothetical protein